MTESLLIALGGILLSLCATFFANWIAMKRLGSQNDKDEGSAAESVSNATITLITPLRNELATTQKELMATREQLGIVQQQLQETMSALRTTRGEVLMFQSEIRLLTTQNAALTLRVTELEAENLRLHRQIDSQTK